MNNITKVSQKVQILNEEYIPQKLRPRFLTGVEAISLREFDSLNANGRSLVSNRWTGESRVRRTVKDKRFPLLLLRIILKQYVPSAGWLRISLDHSKFGYFNVAVLAVSVGQGRSIPIWCVATRYRKAPLLKPLLRVLKILADQLSFDQKRRAVFVMDRWFGIPDLLKWIDGEGMHFIVRMKQDIQVGVPYECLHHTVALGEIPHEDLQVTHARRQWRFVRSHLRSGMKEAEPWFLLTNFTSEEYSRKHVLAAYAERFEIEEHFKDIKWIQDYKWQHIRSKAVMVTVLMFVFFGWWLLHRTFGSVVRKARQRGQHPKKQLSWFRAIWEYWQNSRRRPLFASG